MLEALAAALLVGVINTLSDYISVELKLQSKPIYIFAWIALTCYCVGGLLQGVAAAALSAGFFYAISNVWAAPESRDPNIWRELVRWMAAFSPGLVILFWRRPGGLTSSG
jgi:hypothetical protein